MDSGVAREYYDSKSHDGRVASKCFLGTLALSRRGSSCSVSDVLTRHNGGIGHAACSPPLNTQSYKLIAVRTSNLFWNFASGGDRSCNNSAHISAFCILKDECKEKTD